MSERWVIGRHSVEEVFRVRPKSVKDLWICERSQDYRKASFSDGLKKSIEQSSKILRYVSEKQIQELGSGHQGIAVRVHGVPEMDWNDLESCKECTVLILDQLTDPQNFGAILRSSWLSGVRGIFVTERRSAELTPTVAKVASGGAEHVPIETAGNLKPLLEKLKEIGFWVYALAGDGKTYLWEHDLKGKVAILVGSEGTGIRPSVQAQSDQVVRLPMLNSEASYNAAHATTMALYEIQRQLLKK